MKNNIYGILILSILILTAISNVSFKDGMPTCNNFVINTYLYLALSICVLGLCVYYFHRTLFNGNKDYVQLSKTVMKYILFLYIFSIGLIIYISYSNTFNNTNVLTNHILWLLFIMAFSIILVPRVMSDATEKYVDESIYIVSLIFIVMSSIVYIFPSFFSKTFNFMYTSLLISLLVIIILEVMNIFLTSNKIDLINNRKMISYIAILIFSLYVSYDTKKIIELSKLCTKYPNYPKTSISLFLDVVNLFSRILFLSSNK